MEHMERYMVIPEDKYQRMKAEIEGCATIPQKSKESE